ncbi:NAD(P)-dependent oxidoreductase, partial [bacterium]|nr:NAD(P)-dependent oxidoreductase [bacterium]
VAEEKNETLVPIIACDLTDYDRLIQVLRQYKISVVIHCATRRLQKDGFSQQANVYHENMSSMMNICNASINSDVKRIIHFSSYGVFDIKEFQKNPLLETDTPSPGDFYGLIKRQEENIIEYYLSQKKSLRAVIIRLPGVFGPGKRTGVVYSFIRNALRNESIQINEPDSLFRMVYIEDVLDSLMKVIGKPIFRESATVFHIAGKSVFSLLKLAEEIKEITGSSAEIDLIESDYSQCLILDNQKMEKILKVSPLTLRDSLGKYIKIVKRHMKSFNI